MSTRDILLIHAIDHCRERSLNAHNPSHETCCSSPGCNEHYGDPREHHQLLTSKDIFVIQRVCRQWKQTIAASPTLQEKMFLRLRNKPPETWVWKSDKKRGMKRRPDVTESGGFSIGRVYTPVTLNPFLTLYNQEILPSISERREILDLYNEVAVLGHDGLFDRHSSFMETYISDPASCLLNIQFTYQSTPHYAYRFMKFNAAVSVTVDAATTIGEAIDKACRTKSHITIQGNYPHNTTPTDLHNVDYVDVTLEEAVQKFSSAHEGREFVEDDGIFVVLRGTTDLRHRPVVPTADEWERAQSAGVEVAKNEGRILPVLLLVRISCRMRTYIRVYGVRITGVSGTRTMIELSSHRPNYLPVQVEHPVATYLCATCNANRRFIVSIHAVPLVFHWFV